MKYLYLLYIVLFFPALIQAQEMAGERVFIHTDKNCYVAGEDIWIKFYVVDSDLQASPISKIGYIEICDTERPQIQTKLAIKNGAGIGKITIPANTSSGIYQLSGYTRYMRNGNENTFFKKQIAILNIKSQPESDKISLTDQITEQPSESGYQQQVLISTDQREYSNRTKVNLSLSNIPENVVDLVVSVVRNDSLVSLPETYKQNWTKQISNISPLAAPLQWLPELEGHIVTGELIPASSEKHFITNISFVGDDIRYTNGQIQENNKFNFYTGDIYGPQEIVTTVISNTYDKVPYRLDILSPFSESLPDVLPALKVHPEQNRLVERSIGAQLQELTKTDTLHRQPVSNYYNLPISLSYNLDEYTRFSTLSETILEFVKKVRVGKEAGKSKIRVFIEEEQRYNDGNTLVLLDGIPIYNHEDILSYNPQYIRKIDIYTGRYVFGGEPFECIVSFVTRQKNLPFYQLGSESQLFNYDYPFLEEKFYIPDYSDYNTLNSRKPDFRHTLYWNPSVNVSNKSAELSFYTSDLCGDFQVVVEGLTDDGKIVSGRSHFSVRSK